MILAVFDTSDRLYDTRVVRGSPVLSQLVLHLKMTKMWAGNRSEWPSRIVYLFIYCCMRLWLIVEWCSRFSTMSMLDRRSWRPRDGTRTMGTWDKVIVNGPHSTGARYSSTKIVCMCLVHSHEQRSLAFPRSFVGKVIDCCIQIQSKEKTTNDDKIEPPGRRFGSGKSCFTSTNPYV